MENGTGEVGWRRRLGGCLRRWQWQMGAAAAILVVLAVGWIGYQSSPSFFADFAPNFVADAIVAGIAFLLATVAFGLWERRQQQTEARLKALHILRKELAHNLFELKALIRWSEQGADYFRGQYAAWSPEHPRLKMDSWNLLIQSGLSLALPHDVWLSVADSYSTSDEAITNLFRRVSIASYEQDWSKLVDTCLPEFEQARNLTQDALAKLESGLPQGELRPEGEDA